MPHVEQEMLTISGTYDSEFTPFAECMISPFHYMYYIICQSWDYVYILMTGLFAWISLMFVSDLHVLYQ